MDFETLWKIHEGKVEKKMAIKKRLHKTMLISIVGLLALSVGGFATAKLVQTDNVDYEFVNDPALVGQWQAVDFVKNPEDFKINVRQYSEELYINNLVFTSKGGSLVDIGGSALAPGGLSFTKDHILHVGDKTDSKYNIKTIEGQEYLFMEWKSGDYIFRFEKPSYYILKKINSTDMADFRAQSIRNDKIDLEFVNDPAIVGKWKTVDYVTSPMTFNPESLTNQLGNYLLNVEFKETGITSCIYEDSNGKAFDSFKWTNGKLISVEDRCVESYELKEINGKTYLFFPWINGDVVYRGSSVHYYVLEKE